MCLLENHLKMLWKFKPYMENLSFVFLSSVPPCATRLPPDPDLLPLVSPGSRCDECAPGYYGNPSEPGGRCQMCQCNNNIDMTDPESCDRRTGECRKCLYNTEGPDCGMCKIRYYGDAKRRNCRSELSKPHSCTLNDSITFIDRCFVDTYSILYMHIHSEAQIEILGPLTK